MQILLSNKRYLTGFTLLEIVVVIIVLSIVAGLTAPIFSQGLSVARTTNDNLQTIEKLRYASERMAREIRQVDYNAGAFDISSMSASNFTFTKTDDSVTTVTLVQSGTLLQLGYSSPAITSTLTDEVSNIAFKYYDINNLDTLSTANLVYVEFELTLQNSNSGGSFTQRTRVALRDKS